ncbi:MAG: hypothetical protein B7C55_11385 [Actinomycetales bacterium mxb001]|nr:MAG: hypothetical protein B7C55_11385 [Actinomycetales bacterium mxb001]
MTTPTTVPTPEDATTPKADTAVKRTLPFTSITLPEVSLREVPLPTKAVDAIETVQEAVVSAPQNAAKAWTQVTDFADETRGQVTGLAKDARHHVTKLATDARLQVREFATDARVQATEFAAEARKATSNVAQGASRTVVLVREAVGL